MTRMGIRRTHSRLKPPGPHGGSDDEIGSKRHGYFVGFFCPSDIGLYTHRQKLSDTTFFGDTVLEVAERKMLVMEIKYFEFYCKFYYFYVHLELKKILSTKYLDNDSHVHAELYTTQHTFLCS